MGHVAAYWRGDAFWLGRSPGRPVLVGDGETFPGSLAQVLAAHHWELRDLAFDSPADEARFRAACLEESWFRQVWCGLTGAQRVGLVTVALTGSKPSPSLRRAMIDLADGDGVTGSRPIPAPFLTWVKAGPLA